MIQAVTTPAHKQAFATAIQGAPYFRAVMGRDLALWADNPGAPVRLFTLPGAALTLNGSTAQLCGTPQDWEELLSFLQFAGIAHLIAEETPLLPAAAGEPAVPVQYATSGSSAAGARTSGLYAESQPICLAPGNPAFPAGTGTAGLLLFRNLYRAGPRLCPCAGFAGCSRPPGEHCGAYAMANGEAYMAMGETLPELRGRGIGGWLIPYLANELAGEGWTVTFLCAAERCRFYERLGFVLQKQYVKYKL